MRLGDVGNAAAAAHGKPLDGVRVLAAEQMQALPFATQLLGRLGAEVVKVEHPVTGESGRGATPQVPDPEGRGMGATFLRNNLSKRSVGIDLKQPDGRDLFLRLAPRFDVVAENFKPGTMDRLGLGYDDVRAVHPAGIYVSVSGFGHAAFGTGVDSPYRSLPAYASIVEGMSGIYEWKRQEGRPPVANPVGALGDISSALFAVVGVLAALRHRDRTGLGQHVDVAMYDATVAMTDVVTNFWSLGVASEADLGIGIVETFAASDGHFVLQVVREHHFAKLLDLIGRPEWAHDERFATREGWRTHLDDVLRPAIERWAATRTKRQAAEELSAAGIAAGPSHTSDDVVHDAHLATRDMLVEMPRPDGEGPPVLVPGNPVKLSNVAEGPEARVPWVGEHTAEVLGTELGLDGDELAALRSAGVIA
jgi:crotonobetainyl-CoA:carnitine CoA-transferase CaiB-like acyl-CoA transferase